MWVTNRLVFVNLCHEAWIKAVWILPMNDTIQGTTPIIWSALYQLFIIIQIKTYNLKGLEKVFFKKIPDPQEHPTLKYNVQQGKVVLRLAVSKRPYDSRKVGTSFEYYFCSSFGFGVLFFCSHRHYHLVIWIHERKKFPHVPSFPKCSATFKLEASTASCPLFF